MDYSHNHVQGYSDVMDPKYKVNVFSRWGTTTNPSTPAQLQEFGKKINEGVKNVEIGSLQIETFESIPNEHLKNIKQWSKLIDVDVSLHAPAVGFDLAGIEQGRVWSESKRLNTENFLKKVLERAYLLDQGKGAPNVPVVVHPSAAETKGEEYEKGLLRVKRDRTGREIKDKFGNQVLEQCPDNLGIRSMRIVNTKTGEIQEIKHEKKFSLSSGKEEVWDIQRKLNSANFTAWDKEKRELAQTHGEILEREKRMEELQMNNLRMEQQIERWEEQDPERFKDQINNLKSRAKQNDILSMALEQEVDSFESSLGSQMEDLYDTFQDSGDRSGKAALEKLRKERRKMIKNVAPAMLEQRELERKRNLSNEERQRLYDLSEKVKQFQQNDRNATLAVLSKLKTPKTFKPINEFSSKQVAKTLVGTMVDTYKKLGDRAPVLAVENFWTDTALSRAKDLRPTIENARKEIVKKLKADGVSEKKAKKWVDHHLGINWDIGHMASLRRAGLTNEEFTKIAKKETKMLGEGGMIKHAHMWDNFGFHSSHLPVGTADIPIEDIVKELEQTGFRGRIIEEGGSWTNSFKQSSFPVVLENIQAPLYGAQGGPVWNTNPYNSAHSDSFIEFPQSHFNLYGSSFTTMPKELGGQVGGEKSRFSGTPNQ